MNLHDQSAPMVRLKKVFRPKYLSRGCRFLLFQDQKRGARGGPALPRAPGIVRGFIGSKLSLQLFAGELAGAAAYVQEGGHAGDKEQ
jgi:hypothetical protein